MNGVNLQARTTALMERGMTERKQIAEARVWVVKLGSSLLTADGRGLDLEALNRWASQIAALIAAGKRVVVVSSGAVAEGVARLGWSARPTTEHELQAAAAVGQMGLVHAWEQGFSVHRLKTAQILLTHEDMANRRRYLNARNTLRALLELGVIPIVNENDTVATEEIRLGDNDQIAAALADLIGAEVLLILTDRDGLFDADPATVANPGLIREAMAGDPTLFRLAGSGGALGRGGMKTKLLAAETAARAGTQTLIANGRAADVITRCANGESLGTWLQAGEASTSARKRWIAARGRVRGQLTLDHGAVKVLSGKGKSLLPVGVTAVSGEFSKGDLVEGVDGAGNVVLRGLVNYSASECARLCGKASHQISTILGYSGEPELVHRDNMIVLEASAEGAAE